MGLLDEITAADLTTFARAVPNRADFLLSQSVLPVRVIQNVKYRTRNRSVTVSAAKYRAFNAPTPFLRVDAKRSIREGFLPALGGKEVIEEMESILLGISRGQDDQELVDAIYDNVENQVTAVYTRLELAAGDLLADGILSFDENGFIQDADFGVPANHKPTAGVAWTDPAARRLDDELAWNAALTGDGQARAGRVVTSSLVISGFGANTQYKDTYWGGETAGITRPNLTVEQVNSVRGQYGLAPLVPYDVQVPVDGAMTRVLPESAYLMLPPTANDLGSTTFGITAESLRLSAGSNPSIKREDQAGVISTAKEEDDPVAVTTKTGAVAMPILDEPLAYVAAKVF